MRDFECFASLKKIIFKDLVIAWLRSSGVLLGLVLMVIGDGCVVVYSGVRGV